MSFHMTHLLGGYKEARVTFINKIAPTDTYLRMGTSSSYQTMLK